MHILEILAPAGSYDALIAAVENGADAVYLGGKQFSARASADNFGDLELENAVEYAHLRNVRIYVTVNILIDNSEIKDVMEYIKKLYNLGVDGIIVQDLGLLSLIRKLLPHMRLHASTQMTVHNLEGVKFLEGLGVKRVVISRELSLTEINSIAKQTSLELEVFGHGALCVSYSGQCLMSSLIGTRSGNRGRCAQPCRMAYALVDKSGNEVESKKIGAHLLSPKDLNTLELLPEICSSGIASLKLEGRMKRPEYVATVVQIYRQVLDRLKTNPENFCVSQEEHQKLAQIFNRDFTSGYLKGNPSRDLMSYKRPNNRGIRLGRIERIIDQGRLAEIKLDERLRIGDGVEIWVTKGGRQGYYVNEISRNGVQIDEAEKGDIVSVNIIGKPKVGDRVFKTHDITLIEKAQQSYLKPVKNIPIDLNFQAKEGSPFTLEGLDDEGNSVLYTSTYIVARAKKHPATNETVLQQLSRLGGTGYKIGKVLLDIEEGIMLPASELNAARRFIVEKITQLRLKKFHYPAVNWPEIEKKIENECRQLPPRSSGSLKISVTVSGYETAKAALESGADVIYIGGENFSPGKVELIENIKRTVELGQKFAREIVYIIPRIFQEKDKEELYQKISQVIDLGISGLMVGNIGGITLARDSGWKKGLCGDFGLNIFNNITIKTLIKAGIERVTLSPELSFHQIENMGFYKVEKECIVYGPLPMMVSEYCALGSILGGKKTGTDCTRPCMKGLYGLKDRMNYIFPVEVDQFCRMHIFNPKELCLIQNIDRFINAGIDVLRIEGKRYGPEAVNKIVSSYRYVQECFLKGVYEKIDLEGIQHSLEELTRAGFTKGHYFRGVL
ncbi:MAG: DUF3656 domain-containing U32 family peptidase [Bacillota bacterium]|jgi:putative protease